MADRSSSSGTFDDVLSRRIVSSLTVMVVVAAAGAGCGGSDEAGDVATTSSTGSSSTATAEQRFPDVIDATAVLDGDSWTISATISSPDDTPERYADAWRVVGPDGTVFGQRILDHDHADEQPFERSQSGIMIPAGIDTVTIEGRDLEDGWGGGTVELTLPR